jgi:hypothetical protein
LAAAADGFESDIGERPWFEVGGEKAVYVVNGSIAPDGGVSSMDDV